MIFLFPISGPISSYFGDRLNPLTGLADFHNGIDIPAPEGTEIKAPADGLIYKVWQDGASGNALQIDHGGGFITGYAHLNSYADGINEGKRVRAGDVIGYVGATGASTGPHLHFVLKKDGRPVDPMQYLSQAGTAAGRAALLVIVFLALILAAAVFFY